MPFRWPHAQDYRGVVRQLIEDVTGFCSNSLMWRMLLDAPSTAAVTARVGSRSPVIGRLIEGGLFARALRHRRRRHDDPEAARGRTGARRRFGGGGRRRREVRCEDGAPLPLQLFHLRALRILPAGGPVGEASPGGGNSSSGGGSSGEVLEELEPQLRDPRPTHITEEMVSEPRLQNALRRNKVPLLLVQGCTLNTGHRFVFSSGGWMGELGELRTIHDTNVYLAPVVYDTLPRELADRCSLGAAVAASACVPGAFDPLTLDGLYAGLEVSIIDGGVADNTGVLSLLDVGCDFVHCSDGALSFPLERRCPGAHSFLKCAYRSVECIMLHQTISIMEEAKQRGTEVVHCSLAFNRRDAEKEKVHRQVSLIDAEGRPVRLSSNRLQQRGVRPTPLAVASDSCQTGAEPQVENELGRDTDVNAAEFSRMSMLPMRDATITVTIEVTCAADDDTGGTCAVSFFMEDASGTVDERNEDEPDGHFATAQCEQQPQPVATPAVRLPPSLGAAFSSEALKSIRSLRTSLDTFSEAEAAALCSFSYTAMRSAMRESELLNGAQKNGSDGGRTLPWDARRTADADPIAIATAVLFAGPAYAADDGDSESSVRSDEDASSHAPPLPEPKLASFSNTVPEGERSNRPVKTLPWGFLWVTVRGRYTRRPMPVGASTDERYTHRSAYACAAQRVLALFQAVADTSSPAAFLVLRSGNESCPVLVAHCWLSARLATSRARPLQ